MWLVEGLDSFACGGLGESDAVAAGHHQRNASLILEVSLWADGQDTGIYSRSAGRRRALRRPTVEPIYV